MEQKDRMGSAREQRISALLNLAQKLVQQFGDTGHFDAKQWLEAWLKQPCPALGGQKPEHFLGSDEGAQQIEKVLWQMVAAQSA